MPDDTERPHVVELHPGARARVGVSRDAIGRPPYVPTDENRHTVMVLAANGCKDHVIAAALRIARPTLQKHFRRELITGREQIVARVGYAVVKEALAGNMGAARFWLSVHGGPEWRMPLNAYRDPEHPKSGDDEVVHFYMPPNRRDLPEPDDSPPTIDADVEVEGDAATGTDDAQ